MVLLDQIHQQGEYEATDNQRGIVSRRRRAVNSNTADFHPKGAQQHHGQSGAGSMDAMPKHSLSRHFPFDDDRLRRQPFRVPV